MIKRASYVNDKKEKSDGRAGAEFNRSGRFESFSRNFRRHSLSSTKMSAHVILFRVKPNDNVATGEAIRVLGNAGWLGSWKPPQGLELKWQNDHWEGVAVLDAEAMQVTAFPIEFKFAVAPAHDWSKAVRYSNLGFLH